MLASDLRSAFPASLAPHVVRVAARLGPAEAIRPIGGTRAFVEGESLTIPGRIYFDPGSVTGTQEMTDVERIIMMCLFTRHHDGHVREKYLRLILDRHEPWVAPFVIQLVGEYVVEISEVVRSRFDALDQATYGSFVESNPEFIELTRQRAISYWSAYYRRRYPGRVGYPSFEVLDRLHTLAAGRASSKQVGLPEGGRRRSVAGGAISTRPSIPSEVWRHDLHQRPNGRTIIAKDHLIAPERRSFLTRLDPTSGSPRWSAKVRDTWGWLAQDSERVFYLNQHALVQCLALDSGEARWTASLTGISGWLVPTGPVVLVGGWRGYTPLAALDAATGELRWRMEWAGRSSFAEPVVGPWGVAVAAFDARPFVRFLEPASGTVLGEVPLPDHGQSPDATALLRCSGDRLVLAGRDGRYHALAEPAGDWEAVFTHSTGIATFSPPVLGDAVVFMDEKSRLNCYGLELGERRWSIPWQHGRRDLLPVARSPSGLLAVGSANGRVAVLDPSGTVLWSRVVAKRIETDLVWLDDQTLVTGTTSALVAVRPQLKTGAQGTVGRDR
jgi:outer membrane protein assembly factor BamB